MNETVPGALRGAQAVTTCAVGLMLNNEGWPEPNGSLNT